MVADIQQFIADVYGWPGKVRPNTFDLTAIKEVYVEEVYRAREWMKEAKVLDLGANVGVFSVWAVQHGASKVVAVECCKETFDLLRRNTVSFPIIVPTHAAVGPEAARCNPVYLGDGHAHMSYTPGIEEEGSVPMWTLNELIGDDIYDFVKVDIEGMEWEIFHAASKETMERIRHVGIEFHGTDCPGSSPQPEGAFGRLVEKLSETHCVHTLGAASKGGMIYADAY